MVSTLLRCRTMFQVIEATTVKYPGSIVAVAVIGYTQGDDIFVSNMIILSFIFSFDI